MDKVELSATQQANCHMSCMQVRYLRKRDSYPYAVWHLVAVQVRIHHLWSLSSTFALLTDTEPA